MSTVLAQQRDVLRTLSNLTADQLQGGPSERTSGLGLISRDLPAPVIKWVKAIHLRYIWLGQQSRLASAAESIKDFPLERLSSADADRLCGDLAALCDLLYDAGKVWKRSGVTEAWIFRRTYLRISETRRSMEDSLEAWLLSRNKEFRELIGRCIAEAERELHESRSKETIQNSSQLP